MSNKTKSVARMAVTFVILLYVSGARGQEVGVDRAGKDLKPGFDLTSDDPQLCKAACDTDPNCKAYTYVKPNTVQGPNPRCWLKSDVPAAVKNNCCVSGFKGEEVGVDRPGKDLKPGFDLTSDDPQLCKLACDADPNCKAYTYVKPNTIQGPKPRCWLKSDVPVAVNNNCCVSGVKVAATTTPTATPTGCIDWSHPPAGIVFGLRHSTNQKDKRLVWDGALYDPASAQIPPGVFMREDGGDLDGHQGEGYYWYETNGIGFQFQANSPSTDAAEMERWRIFSRQLPSGLVFGLKHSVNQPGKALLWLGEVREFTAWRPEQYDPVNEHLLIPMPFERQNGGDRDGSAGQGYYWYEVSPDMVQTSACDASLPGGLAFGLKHSMNQPNKKLTWHGQVFDAAQRGGPRPPGFARCHGGDLGAPSGQGYYWFETVGQGSTQQNSLGGSCGY